MKRGIYCIEWEDACSWDGFYDKDYEYNAVICKTVGHLLKHNKEVILLCGMSFNDRTQKHIHLIPRKSIKKITYLWESSLSIEGVK